MSKGKTNAENCIYTYYQKIKDGSIVVGTWINLIYEYIIKGLEDRLFYFDQKKATAAIEFVEQHCFHSEGVLAPGALKLELWQKAMLSAIFGVVDEEGRRQFREVVLIVSRKNGKSLIASAIAKYVFQIDGGYGAKVFCIAPKLEQASIIYNDIWQHVVLDPEWQALKLAIDQSRDEHNRKTADTSELTKLRQSDIYLPATNSSIKKIAFSERKSDGLNPSMVICDEVASWVGDKGLKQYEVLKSAFGSRPEGLLLSCSTAGYEKDGIYDELIRRSTAFLKGNSKEKRLLPFLYMIDDVEEWNSINELQKSNPNMGVSVSVDYLLEEIAIAEGSLSKKNEFLTKYCNVQQNSSHAWLDSVTIEKAFGDPLKLEDFRGCYCVGGIDLSQTTDLTSCCVVIEKNGELFVFSQFYLPESKIDEATARDGVPYRIYIQQGLLKTSGDAFVDYHDCYNWFVSLVRDYKIYPLQVGYDRYSAQYLVQDLEQSGFHMDDVFQGFNLTPVIRETEGLLKEGKVHCGDNNLLKLHLFNSALKQDTELNKVRLIKLNANDHIDGCAALLDALCVRQKWYGEIGQQLRNEGK